MLFQAKLLKKGKKSQLQTELYQVEPLLKHCMPLRKKLQKILINVIKNILVKYLSISTNTAELRTWSNPFVFLMCSPETFIKIYVAFLFQLFITYLNLLLQKCTWTSVKHLVSQFISCTKVVCYSVLFMCFIFLNLEALSDLNMFTHVSDTFIRRTGSEVDILWCEIKVLQNSAESIEIPPQILPKNLSRFILALPMTFCLTCNQNNSNPVTVCISAKPLNFSSRQQTLSMTACLSDSSWICQASTTEATGKLNANKQGHSCTFTLCTWRDITGLFILMGALCVLGCKVKSACSYA